MGCYYYSGRYYGYDDVPESYPDEEERMERDRELYEEACIERAERRREQYD